MVTGGTATAEDFSNPVTITIPAGTYNGAPGTAVATGFQIRDDAYVEPDETIELTLASPTGVLAIGDADGDTKIQDSRTYTILVDDDSIVGMEIRVSASSDDAEEIRDGFSKPYKLRPGTGTRRRQ